MSKSLHTFLTHVTPKAAKDLLAAYYSLPEDKRNWSPMGEARTATDMIAECAQMSDVTDFIEARAFPADFDYAAILSARSILARDPEGMIAMLHDSVARTLAAIETVPEEDIEIVIDLPWGALTLGEIMAYPYWNMSYHTGQINYIASMLANNE